MKITLIKPLVFWILISTYAAVALADSSGTGFFISSNGLLATNFHVIEGAATIEVKTTSETLVATVLTVDKANDIALLQVKPSGPTTPLTLTSSSDVRRGSRVFTVGYPHISIQGAEPKVTDGLISSLSGMEDDPRFFQISVPVQPGNSGGPLVTFDGSVIGIVSAQLNALAMAEAGAGLPQNVNYAVKSNYVFELTRAYGVKSTVLNKSNGSAQRVDFETIVERVENATVLVLAKGSIKPVKNEKQSEVAMASQQSLPPIELGGLEFIGIKMARRSRSLYVEDVSAAE